MATEKKIQRVDLDTHVEMYANSYYEMEEVKQKIKDAKAEIDKDYAEQLESLETEMEQHANILRTYSKQNGSETTEMPNGVKFGFFDKENYNAESETMIETLSKFKEKFPNNFQNFLTGYPKFSKTKMDRLIEDGHITLEELKEIGIEKDSVSEFEVKVPKKK